MAGVDDVRGYDAVVIGSAVYHGHWLEAALDMVLRCAIDLFDRPVRIFSSGPVGDHGWPPEELLEADEVLVQTRAREHQVFAGRLDRAGLRPAERVVSAVLLLREANRRDPAGAQGWGRTIAVPLTTGLPGR